MIADTNEIAIRSIQHYIYCPHRWGLIEVGRVWSENAFVVKANIMHKRVHDNENSYVPQKGKKVHTAVKVYNDKPEYGIYGVTDCIETDEKNNICIVEYKPTKPKTGDYNYEDLMQVFAQKVCVDYIFGCDCDAVIYYGDIKRRIKLPIKENYSEYDNALKTVITEMRQNIKKGLIPAIRKGQKCSGCSMKDLCMPEIKKRSSVREMIDSIWEGEL